MTDLITELVAICERAEAKAKDEQVSCGTVEGHGLRLADFCTSETRAVAEGRMPANADDCQSKAESSSGQSGYSSPTRRTESLEELYQLVQRLRFDNSGDAFDVLMRVETYLLNELLKEFSVTREFAASA